MQSVVVTLCFNDVCPSLIRVQAHFIPGLPDISIIGLPDRSVSESKDRIKSVLHQLGIGLPPKRIVVNLVPSSLKKSGSHFDLSILLSILVLINVISQSLIENYIFFGELSLNGDLNMSKGLMSAIFLATEKSMDVICPLSSGEKIYTIGSTLVFPAKNVQCVLNHILDRQVIVPVREDISSLRDEKRDTECNHIDLIHNQDCAKRSLAIAISGNHHILFAGPPGCGKSLLCTAVPDLLPPLSMREYLEVSLIYSHFNQNSLPYKNFYRPFRAPHCTSSLSSMVGGGLHALPGEISLAHRGVLFLDELLEFSPEVLNALRHPIESGKISICRSEYRMNYMSRFQLVSSTNLCRCGYYGVEDKCTCTIQSIRNYRRRLSSAFLNRIDISIFLHPNTSTELFNFQKPKEKRDHLYKNILRTRLIQKDRNKRWDRCSNGNLPHNALDEMIKNDDSIKNLCDKAIRCNKLNARSYYSVLRVARTIADYSNVDRIKEEHVLEALGLKISMNI